MKNLIVFIFLVIVTLISCDGRITKQKSLANSVETFKKDTLIEQIKYIPENYQEIATDTIMSNGFTVKIKTFTNMQDSILKEFKQDSVAHKRFYRAIECDLAISFGKRQIFEKTITKSFIENNIKGYKSVLENSNLESVWLDQNYSIDKNSIHIELYFRQIESEIHKVFILNVSKDGSYNLEPLQEKIY